MKKLSIFVNPKVRPILKGSSRTFAIVLDEAPAGDVTVSFSSENSFVTFGSSLTFTTGNYNVPQTITITAVANATPEGYKEETIICTPSGGYSKELKFKINICDTYIDYELLRRKQWYGTHIRQLSDIVTLRTSMIDYLLNGNGMPTNAIPDSLVSSYTGVCGQFNTSNLTGVTRVDSLTFNFTDWRAGVWASKVYHIITSSTPKNILVMVIGGHGSELYHLNCVQDLLNNGFDVAYCFLPITFQNTTTSPGITGTGVNGHNEIEEDGLETPSFSGMELFLYDKIMALNYMDANYSYTEYYGTGCSGGGNMMKTVQAIDTRVTRTVCVRGYQAYSGVAWEAGKDFASDYEQGGSPATQLSIMESNYYDHIYLGTSGGRRHYATHNALDTIAGTFSFNLYKDFLPPKVHAMTGGSFGLYLDTNVTYATHGFNVNDRIKILEQFLAP